MLRRSTAVLVAAFVLGATAAPAALAQGRDGARKGGKKPVGTVASFDGTTLTVTMKDGSTETATASEDTKVKVEHRGQHARSGNPSNGTLADLVTGAFVLRMKTEDGALEKIRIRRAPAAVEAPAEETTEAPADEATETPAEETTETPADETTETPAEETAETPAEEVPVEETVDPITEEVPVP